MAQISVLQNKSLVVVTRYIWVSWLAEIIGNLLYVINSKVLRSTKPFKVLTKCKANYGVVLKKLKVPAFGNGTMGLNSVRGEVTV